MFRGLTQTGANYLATRLANALPVNFTKVKIGSGTASGNPYATTNLNNYIQDAKILTKVQEENSINITVQITNENRQQGFYLKEIGVFVDDNGTEKLYWYCNEDNAQYVPAASDSAIAFEIEIKMEVTNQESTILNWSGKGTWIDREYLERELAKKENVFDKNSGFNLNKTDSYEEDDTNKVGTARALKRLYDWIRNKLASLTLSWDRITNKPNLTTTENLTQLLKGKENAFEKKSGFNKEKTDDYFYGDSTERLLTQKGGNSLYNEFYNKNKALLGKRYDKFPVAVAEVGNIYFHEKTNKFYICVKNYNGISIENPNSNFEELNISTNKLIKNIDNINEREIKLNGIIIKIIKREASEGMRRYDFSTPFPNECFIVICTENDGLMKYQVYMENWDKNGFKANATSIRGAFYALAIGY